VRLMIWPCPPACRTSGPLVRVSSAATIAAAASTAEALGLRSAKFPIGVATTYSPGTNGEAN
jgi:hypothetical protein